ncbi:hypothetical protein HZP42_19130 [Elizabethkingia anophelis]|nr:hypothetical protein [Elizabethkingia anophelis]
MTKFEPWFLRVKLIILDMGIMKAETIDKQLIPDPWKDLFNAGLRPIEAIKEQEMNKEDKCFYPSEEYEKYIAKLRTL